MKIIIARIPYMDYEVGDVVDLGEEKNASMVELQRAVWVEEEEKKKPTRKATKTTTQTQSDVTEEDSEKPEGETQEIEAKTTPARGPDGKFISKEETEEPKKK